MRTFQRRFSCADEDVLGESGESFDTCIRFESCPPLETAFFYRTPILSSNGRPRSNVSTCRCAVGAGASRRRPTPYQARFSGRMRIADDSDVPRLQGLRECAAVFERCDPANRERRVCLHHWTLWSRQDDAAEVDLL